MRPLAFSPDSLRKLLLHDKIATLPDLKRALGTDVDLTVFRKLKELDYLTSYSHGGRFYTLREIARFGADGLWSCTPAWFSRYGTLLATAEAFIRSSAAGYFAEELSAILQLVFFLSSLLATSVVSVVWCEPILHSPFASPCRMSRCQI